MAQLLTKQKDIKPCSIILFYQTETFDLMKQLFIILTMFLLAHSSFAQQSFNAKGNNTLDIKIPSSKFALQSTKTQSIVVDLEVNVNYPKAVIDQLQKVDRYKIVAKSQDGTLVFTTPNLKQSVTIGGKTLTEEIKINVKAPNGFMAKGTLITKSERIKTIEQPVQVNIRFVYPKTPVATAKEGKTGSSPTSPNRMGTVQKRGSNKVPTATREVQSLYGDIIIGNMPIDDFYD